MKKIIITLTLLLSLSVASMQAQEFQWAKGWTSGDNISGVPSNTIVKSLFDREGNIYILGTFGYGARLDGVELLPMPDPDSLTYSQRQFYMTVLPAMNRQVSLHSHSDRPETQSSVKQYRPRTQSFINI